jgi:hypothetical protein
VCEEITKTKVVNLKNLYNFIVENFFIWINLHLKICFEAALCRVQKNTRQSSCLSSAKNTQQTSSLSSAKKHSANKQVCRVLKNTRQRFWRVFFTLELAFWVLVILHSEKTRFPVVFSTSTSLSKVTLTWGRCWIRGGKGQVVSSEVGEIWGVERAGKVATMGIWV